jgi:hypothetical protein
MTTVGYGDVVPGNALEQIASMVGMVVGVTIFTYLTGSLISLLSAFQSESEFISDRKQKLEEFIRDRKLPLRLAVRMRNYYGYALLHMRDGHEATILNGLSYSLRYDVQVDD